MGWAIRTTSATLTGNHDQAGSFTAQLTETAEDTSIDDTTEEETTTDNGGNNSGIPNIIIPGGAGQLVLSLGVAVAAITVLAF